MPLHAASAIDVNEGETITDEVVAHMHDIRPREKDHRIAVGMPRREMQGTDVLTVQMHGDVLAERNYRQGGLGRQFVFGPKRGAVADDAAGL